MAFFYVKQKFPCGYELRCELSGFGIRNFSGLPELGICPLHGKECVESKKGGDK